MRLIIKEWNYFLSRTFPKLSLQKKQCILKPFLNNSNFSIQSVGMKIFNNVLEFSYHHFYIYVLVNDKRTDVKLLSNIIFFLNHCDPFENVWNSCETWINVSYFNGIQFHQLLCSIEIPLYNLRYSQLVIIHLKALKYCFEIDQIVIFTSWQSISSSNIFSSWNLKEISQYADTSWQ